MGILKDIAEMYADEYWKPIREAIKERKENREIFARKPISLQCDPSRDDVEIGLYFSELILNNSNKDTAINAYLKLMELAEKGICPAEVVFDFEYLKCRELASKILCAQNDWGIMIIDNPHLFGNAKFESFVDGNGICHISAEDIFLYIKICKEVFGLKLLFQECKIDIEQLERLYMQVIKKNDEKFSRNRKKCYHYFL